MTVLRLLASVRTPVLDQLMLLFSYLGTPFAVVAVIGWFYLNVDKEEAYGMSLSFCLSSLLCQGIKILARVPRPWNLDTTFEAHPAALPTASGYSFPSGHTQSATALYVSVFYYNKKKAVRILSLVLLALIGFSRMYLGCHTPLDVFTAFALTTVVTVISWFIWNRHHRTFAYDNLIPWFLLAFAAVLLFLVSALLANATVDYANAKDSFEIAGVVMGFAVSFFLEARFVRFSTAGSLPKKVLRFLIAIIGALMIEFGLKRVSGTNIPLLVFRYFLMSLWLLLGTPLLAMRLGLASRMSAVRRLPQI